MLSSKLFDHTILKADAVASDVDKICEEAKKYDFASVCVNEYYTAYVAEKLKGTDVKVCTVVGFPLGMTSTAVKCFETKTAVEEGAEEIDMVMNIGALKDGNDTYILNDILKVKETCGQDIILKVIIETCLLTEEEKQRACELSMKAGADFVKTSTGFSTGGAEAADVQLMKSVVGDKLKVKASGGIRTLDKAEAMVEAGADRLGTSATVDIYMSSAK